MPITVEWYDEDETIIIVRYVGDWTIEDLLSCNQRLNQLAKIASGRFDIIADTTAAAFTPPVGLLWEWKQNVTMREAAFPNWHLSIFVVTTPVLEAYYTAGVESSEALQDHSWLVKSVEDAVMIIVSDRQSAIPKPPG